MARSATAHEPVTNPPVGDPLTQARRRFLGALILFVATVAVLPFVMDAEPPAPLKEPSIEVRDDRQQVILSRRPVEAPPLPQPPGTEAEEDYTPQSPAATQPSAASLPPAGSQPSAPPQPSGTSPPASAVAKSVPPAAPHAPPSAKSAESSKERAAAAPAAEPSKPAVPPAVSAQQGEPARTKPSANIPVWSPIPVHERARAEAALRGLTGPGRPLEQFWYLQAGAFKEREAAEGLVMRLRSAGLPAYLVPPSGASDGGWYRVRVAPYVSESDAKAAAAQVARTAGSLPSVAVARISR